MTNKVLLLCRGSAWGLGLFESPWDCRRIDEFNKEADIEELTKVTNEKIILKRSPSTSEASLKALRGYRQPGVRLTVMGIECSDVETVRKHLDSGVLEKMFARAQKEVTPAGVQAPWPNPNYTIVLLGACAMGIMSQLLLMYFWNSIRSASFGVADQSIWSQPSLGWKLPAGLKDIMREKSQDMSLQFQHRARAQLQAALHPETGYVEGLPYDFGSKTKAQVFGDGGAPLEDRLHPNSLLVDCMSPYGVPAMPKDILSESALHEAQEAASPSASATLRERKAKVSKVEEEFRDAFDTVMETAIPRVLPNIRGDTQDEKEFNGMQSLKAALEHRQDMEDGFNREVAAAGVRPLPMYEGFGSPKVCSRCFKKGDQVKLMLCGRCKKDGYCSKACQKAHWKSHKVSCNDNPKVMEMMIKRDLEADREI